MIELTSAAIKHLKTFADNEDIGHYCIRLYCRGGGCGGIIRDIVFDDIISEMDEVFEQDGIKVIVDCVSLSYLGETEIDYVSSNYGGGFRFVGPETHMNCGCGSSFSP